MIVKALLSSPGVRIYAESVLPSRAPKFNRWSEEVNRDIRQLADGKSIDYVDLRPEFFDENHLLDTRYTYDGLHLNASGYLLWKRQIDPIVLQLTGLRRHLQGDDGYGCNSIYPLTCVRRRGPKWSCFSQSQRLRSAIHSLISRLAPGYSCVQWPGSGKMETPADTE